MKLKNEKIILRKAIVGIMCEFSLETIEITRWCNDTFKHCFKIILILNKVNLLNSHLDSGKMDLHHQKYLL